MSGVCGRGSWGKLAAPPHVPHEAALDEPQQLEVDLGRAVRQRSAVFSLDGVRGGVADSLLKVEPPALKQSAGRERGKVCRAAQVVNLAALGHGWREWRDVEGLELKEGPTTEHGDEG